MFIAPASLSFSVATKLVPENFPDIVAQMVTDHWSGGDMEKKMRLIFFLRELEVTAW